MNLSNSELKLVEDLDQIRKRKIKGLAAVAIVLVVYWILRYVGVLESVDIPVDSLLIIYFGFLVGDTFSNLRSESRYAELLRRYVNNDPDTLLVLSERNKLRQKDR
jgi:hypothetical protein